MYYVFKHTIIYTYRDIFPWTRRRRILPFAVRCHCRIQHQTQPHLISILYFHSGDLAWPDLPGLLSLFDHTKIKSGTEALMCENVLTTLLPPGYIGLFDYLLDAYGIQIHFRLVMFVWPWLHNLHNTYINPLVHYNSLLFLFLFCFPRVICGKVSNEYSLEIVY